MVKNLPATWETWVWSLGHEDPLEKGMATHSSILSWRIPWTEEPGGLPSVGLQRVGYDWVSNTHWIKDRNSGLEMPQTILFHRSAWFHWPSLSCCNNLTFNWVPQTLWNVQHSVHVWVKSLISLTSSSLFSDFWRPQLFLGKERIPSVFQNDDSPILTRICGMTVT